MRSTEFSKGRVNGRGAILAIRLAALAAVIASASASAAKVDLTAMSIEELMGVEITSASKRTQTLGEVPAAIYVIHSEDIRRSGATTIPEALRLAPGLAVARVSGSEWAITARGFNSSFSNKLLVLIDGRSVYTPLFSGTYWNIQDTILEDIDRIEVIRGPGGTVWGANAVNGVINIITKQASETQGLLISAGSGSIERGFVNARYGGTWENASYRAYVKYFDREDFDAEPGGGVNDAWDAAQGGFRIDWDLGETNQFTLQGDGYGGDSDVLLKGGAGAKTQVNRGGNILARFEHAFEDGSALQLQTYYDHTEKEAPLIFNEDRDTFDLDANYQLRRWGRHRVQLGAGYRVTTDSFTSIGVVISPADQTDHLVSAFIQDEISLIEDRLSLTIGSKFEYNDYTDFEVQPSARFLYTPHAGHAFWGSVSRAVRTPSRADHGVTFTGLAEDIPFTMFQTFLGSTSFDSETLLAYEVGYRAQPIEPVSIDIAAYFNDYDDLQSPETLGCTTPGPPPICIIETLLLANKREANGWGVELAASWVASPYWKFEGSYTYMRVELDNSASSDKKRDIEGDTPHHQLRLASFLNLPWNLEFDTTFYWIDELRTEKTGWYERLDLRLAWHPLEKLELSLVGQNLTRDGHLEFDNGFVAMRSVVPRSVYGKATWRY